MPQEYKDYVFANGGIEGQVTPTNNVTPGALTTVSSVYIATPTAAYTTGTGVPGFNSRIAAQQVLAVTPFTYSSPGGKAGAL
jgi:hypothetical protein